MDCLAKIIVIIIVFISGSMAYIITHKINEYKNKKGYRNKQKEDVKDTSKCRIHVLSQCTDSGTKRS